MHPPRNCQEQNSAWPVVLSPLCSYDSVEGCFGHVAELVSSVLHQLACWSEWLCYVGRDFRAVLWTLFSLVLLYLLFSTEHNIVKLCVMMVQTTVVYVQRTILDQRPHFLTNVFLQAWKESVWNTRRCKAINKLFLSKTTIKLIAIRKHGLWF